MEFDERRNTRRSTVQVCVAQQLVAVLHALHVSSSAHRGCDQSRFVRLRSAIATEPSNPFGNVVTSSAGYKRGTVPSTSCAPRGRRIFNLATINSCSGDGQGHAADQLAAGPLRVLVLAPDCNPDWPSSPLVGYSHSEALARLHSVTLAVRKVNEAAIRRRHPPFQAIEPVSMPWADRISEWMMRWIFKGNYRSQVLTAAGYFFALAFEWRVWRRMRSRILNGEFDVVLRLMPITYVLPSPFAFFLRNGPVPFVLGPVNGGLPWPDGFTQAKKQRQWISAFRDLYRFLPFARSTYRNAAAIIAASSRMCAEFAPYREKVFFVPENGVSRCRDSLTLRDGWRTTGRLELIFVGGLVPYKACDLGVRAAAALMVQHKCHFTIVGDGPERHNLERLAESLGVTESITFCGSVDHSEVEKRLTAADMLVFPSVREFGGGVVFEALAMGTVPLVVDFGGPGDIVHPGVGFKVALTNEDDVVRQIAEILQVAADNPETLDSLKREGIRYARERLTWDAKAQSVTRILNWVLGRGSKPELVAADGLRP